MHSRSSKWLGGTLMVAAWLLLGPGACSSETEETASGGAGGAPAATYGASECGVCVKGACSEAIVGCQSDPECVGYLECLYGCGVGEDGNVEAECEAACPAGTSTAAQQAKAALTTCRELGAGADCPACNVASTTGPQHPLLNQQCEPVEGAGCLPCSLSHCCETRPGCPDPVPNNPEVCTFTDCMIACVDTPGCAASCAEMFPESVVVDYAEQNACLFYWCAAETTDCSGVGRDACASCLYVTCGDAFTAYVSTYEGFLLWTCITDCPLNDTACDQVCYDTYPEAMDAYHAVGDCLATLCQDVC
jgi:hypothetical protein